MRDKGPQLKMNTVSGSAFAKPLRARVAGEGLPNGAVVGAHRHPVAELRLPSRPGLRAGDAADRHHQLECACRLQGPAPP